MAIDRGSPPGPGATALARTSDIDDEGLVFPVPARLSSWLPEGGRSPAGRGQVEQWSRSFLEDLAAMRRARASFDASEGGLAHTAGTYLLELHGHQAWETLGLADFDELCAVHLRIGRTTAYRLMFFARIASEQTATLGVRKCVAGYALAKTLGVDGIAALLPDAAKWKEPAEWAQKLGEPVDFAGSTAARVETLVVRLAPLRLPAGPPGAKVRAVVKQRLETIRRVEERHPALAALAVRSFALDGAAWVTNRKAATPEQFAALAALYAALARG